MGYSQGKIVVAFKKGTTEERVQSILVEHDLAVSSKVGRINSYFVIVPVGKEKHFCDVLAKCDDVEYAERIPQRKPIR